MEIASTMCCFIPKTAEERQRIKLMNTSSVRESLSRSAVEIPIPPDSSPVKRQRSRRTIVPSFSSEKSRLESLPQDLLIRVICGVDHEDLKSLNIASKSIREAGKTLAFVLPILESLTNGPAKSRRKNGYGRPPSILVLLPTRELAKHVFADFDAYGGAVGLTSCCLYGGDSYRVQEYKLKIGVDIFEIGFKAQSDLVSQLLPLDIVSYVSSVRTHVARVSDIYKYC